MKVKELIEELQKCNPEAQVVFRGSNDALAKIEEALNDAKHLIPDFSNMDVVAAEQHNPMIVEIFAK